MNLSCMHPSADDGSHVTRGCEAVRKIGAVFSDDGGVDPYVVTSPQASCVANIHQRERERERERKSGKKGTCDYMCNW